MIGTSRDTMEQRYLKALYDILEFSSNLRDAAEDKVWIRVVEKLAVVLDAEAATYFVVGVKGRELIPYYALGIAPEKIGQIPIEIGRGICGWVATHRESLLVKDAYQDPRFMQAVDQATGFRTRSMLCIPLMDRLDLTGVVELINKRGEPFTEVDLEFVEAVCGQVSTHLRLLKLEAMLNKVTAHNASILENLTGGFLAVDLRGKVILCNPAAKRILELTEEVVNVPVQDALRHIKGLPEVLTQTVTTRTIVKRQDLKWEFNGQPRLLGYSTLLIQDPQGNFTGAGITFQDITQVKR